MKRVQSCSSGIDANWRKAYHGQYKVPGIVGPVTNLMRVPEELEKAIDAALDNLVQAVVVEDWKAVVSASSVLQELDAEIGRAHV